MPHKSKLNPKESAISAQYAKAGRPSDYHPDQAKTICDRLAAGETLRQICRDDDMPCESTVRGWALDNREGFSLMYGRARSIGYDCLGEGLIEISDDKSDDPNSRRVRIDARKWLLSKLRPDKYGDRLSVDAEVSVSIGAGIRKRLEERRRAENQSD